VHRWKKNSWFIFLGYGYILAKYISLKFDQWNLLLIKKRTLHDRSPAATACPPLHHCHSPCRIGSTIRTYYLPLAWNLKFDPARGVDVVARTNNPQGGNTHNDSWCKLSGICNMDTTRLPRLIKGDMLGGCQSFIASWHWSQPTIFVEKDALNMLFQPIPVFWDLRETFVSMCHVKNIWKDCRTTTEAARSCIWTLQKIFPNATMRSYPDSWSVSLVTSPCAVAWIDPVKQEEHSLLL